MYVIRCCTLSLAVLLAAGCTTLTPTYQRPSVALPTHWDGDTASSNNQSGTTVTAAGWQAFGSPELDQLMSEALANNHDLAAAVQRIEQARATLRAAQAGQMPSVEFSGSGSGTWQRGQADNNTQGLLSVNYEIDLWGAVAADTNAAAARLAASVFSRDAATLVLQADLASNYFQILALQDRLRIARANLAASREVLTLIAARVREGAASGLELAQQQASVLSQEAQIPTLEQQIAVTKNALAVLLGRPPQGFVVQGNTLNGLHLPSVVTGQPAALLERRPDVRQAEAQLQAAQADIGAARAALYPHLNLSATGTVSGLLSGGSSTVAALAASLAQTLFDGGQLAAQVESAEAARAELAEQYLQAVLTGWQEVQDSLATLAANQARAATLAQVVEQTQTAYQLAAASYAAGAEDLLTLLDSQRQQLQAEDDLVQAILARYTATASLYKALGGGWEERAIVATR